MFHSVVSRSGSDSIMEPIEIVRKRAITLINLRKPKQSVGKPNSFI